MIYAKHPNNITTYQFKKECSLFVLNPLNLKTFFKLHFKEMTILEKFIMFLYAPFLIDCISDLNLASQLLQKDERMTDLYNIYTNTKINFVYPFDFLFSTDINDNLYLNRRISNIFNKFEYNGWIVLPNEMELFVPSIGDIKNYDSEILVCNYNEFINQI